MAGTSNLPAVARRFTRALPAIGPRARTRLLAGFLTLHLAVVLVTVVDVLSRGELVPEDWHRPLHPYIEGGPADRYSGVLFGAVALLAAAQALRPPAHRSGPRWLWVVGWLSMAFFIAMVAFDELYGPRAGFMWRGDVNSFVDLPLPEQIRWVLVALPFSALPAVAPFAVLPAAAACWVLGMAQRGHPARALLTLLVVVVSLGSLVGDAFDNMLVNLLFVDWLGYLESPLRLAVALEEGSEVMAATALGVIFIEMLAAGTRSAGDAPMGTRARVWWLAAFAAAAGLLAISLTISAPPLVRHQLHKGDGWETAAPWAYTGPITSVEQPFRAHQDNLTRIDVWAYADGGPGTAEIFARLTPEGSDRPIRESRATVDGARYSNATVTFDFAPIPDSRGTVYTLAVGVLSGSTPYVFLGMVEGEVFPEGAASIGGAPTSFGNDLAMRTVWIGRFIDGQHPGLIGEVLAHVFLWVWLVVIAWAGLSGRRPRFGRRFVWPTVGISALVTAGIGSIMLAIFALHSPPPIA